jgi:hypothetical protein
MPELLDDLHACADALADRVAPVRLDDVVGPRVVTSGRPTWRDRPVATARSSRRLRVALGAAAVVALLAGAFAWRIASQSDHEVQVVTEDGTDPGTGGGRLAVSPLATIKDRLTKDAAEVFTVSSPTCQNWRLTSLDLFAGDVWHSGGSFVAVPSGELAGLAGSAPPSAADETVQHFTIEALGSLWLPAAYLPTSVTPGTDLSWQASSATLVVNRAASSDGLSYTVTSAVPQFTEDGLRAATGDIPAAISTGELALPDNFSTFARQIATDQTAGAATPYDKARALQDYFRHGFTYSTDVPSGQGEAAIDTFLKNRVGYAEQFAGTYAAMARAVGLPARVGVGYTCGTTDPTDPTIHHVHGGDAHAWPEVYLAGAGWVPFEPTPGHAAAAAAAWQGPVS